MLVLSSRSDTKYPLTHNPMQLRKRIPGLPRGDYLNKRVRISLITCLKCQLMVHNEKKKKKIGRV